LSQLLIDVGLKTEGRVPLREFRTLGDEVEVYSSASKTPWAKPCCRATRPAARKAWVRLESRSNDNERVDGVIFNRVKGGFTVDLGGAVAFLPGSQVDIRPVRDVTPLMNMTAAVPDPQDGQAPRQHRGVAPHDLEESRAEQRSELVQNLEEGQVVEGVVKNITDYGAFVDLGGIDGLLHVTDMAWRASTIRPRFCRSARPSRSRSSRSTRKPSASALA
jgi:small subunit ribosomal protein S1